MPASAGQAAEDQRGDSDSRADLPGNHWIEALFDYLLHMLYFIEICHILCVLCAFISLW